MRAEIMNNFNKENIAFCTVKLGRNADYHNYFLANNITDKGISSSLDNANIFPLYIYSKNKGQQTIDQTTERKPNLNPEIVKQIAAQLGLNFVPDHELCHAELVSASQQTLKQVQGDKTVFTPLDLLDYIYAVLHSPNYREKYKEFLKIDFPRVPYPKDAATFWQLVQLGGQIRQIHLLESSIVEKYITGYPEDGDNIVIKPKYENGKVFINDTQYFSNVPEVAWNFYIGGYQPAQKWLKDRKDRKLEFDDILHYQKIIVALSETDRLMKEIDAIEIE
jgi:predicted helicase